MNRFVSPLKAFLPKNVSSELGYWLRGGQINPDANKAMESIKTKWDAVERDLICQTSLKQNFLFATGYGLGSHYQTIEPMIAEALRSKGHTITSIICGSTLEACEMNLVGGCGNDLPSGLKVGLSKASNTRVCRQCCRNIRRFYNNFDFELVEFKEFLNSKDYDEAYEFAENFATFNDYQSAMVHGVNVGEEVNSSIIRATFMGEVKRTPENLKHIKRYLYSGFLAVSAYRRCIIERQIDKVVTIHGVYLVHGLAAKVGRSLGIPTWVLGGGGIRKNTVIVSADDTYHRTLVEEPNDSWKDSAISDLEKQSVLDYARRKKFDGGAADYCLYNPNPIEDKKAVLDILGISSEKPIVSIFTNVIWDAQVIYSSNAFKDIFDWMKQTIDNLAQNKDVNAVVRIHPAEVKGNTNPTMQKMASEIDRMFPVLPDNIFIVPPESDISSYTLADLSVGCIVYGTKLSLEMALMGRRVIVCGETFSRGKGFTIDIADEAQYATLCADIQSVGQMSEKEMDLALKYANYLYFNRMIDLPYDAGSGDASGSGKSLGFSKTSELLQAHGIVKILEILEG